MVRGDASNTHMAFKVRSSKFRHVYGNPYKREACFENIKITRNAHDGNFCAVNPNFLAVVTESGGGGTFVVLPVEKTGRVDVNAPKVCGHKGPVLDIKWNPFDDHVIASCSDDSTVKIWQVPENGLMTSLSDWQVDLHGHQRRVGYIEWHPTAENILLSAGYDHKCILWNTETAEPINIIDCHTENIFSISWNRDGSLFTTTSKDKKVRLIDPRTGDVVGEAQAHSGPKTCKSVFLGDTNKIFTTGFAKYSDRELAIWDIKNMSKPLKTESIDATSGVLFPFYDNDTKVVFLAGKGDGNIRYYEIADDSNCCYYLNQFTSQFPQRGLGIMPKRGVDVTKCEITRFYKLHSTRNMVEPISMIVPRKSETFQDDVYPPTASGTPSLTADEWISGQNRDPILISLQDGHVTSTPIITTARALQKKDGTLSQTPVITTYKASKGDRHDYTKMIGNSPSSPSHTIPNSVRNIQALASQTSPEPAVNRDVFSEKLSAFEKRDNFTVSRTTVTNSNQGRVLDKKVWSPNAALNNMATSEMPNTNPESPMSPTKSPEAISPEAINYFALNDIEIIDTSPPILPQAKKTKLECNDDPDSTTPALVKPSSLGLNRRQGANPPVLFLDSPYKQQTKPEETPKASKFIKPAAAPLKEEKIHVVKVWSPTKSPEIPMENGLPKTDPELRKAYFRQLEEIKSLKQQLTLKDKRIRQLEEELKTNKNGCNGQADEHEQYSESSC